MLLWSFLKASGESVTFVALGICSACLSHAIRYHSDWIWVSFCFGQLLDHWNLATGGIHWSSLLEMCLYQMMDALLISLSKLRQNSTRISQKVTSEHYTRKGTSGWLFHIHISSS
jgi:hypothetical protein